MLVFGIIVVAIFVQQLRGAYTSLFPAQIIAMAYIGIGAWALFASNYDPFFWIFIVPGALLALASFANSAISARLRRL